MTTYIHERSNYPHFIWDASRIMDILTQVANMQGQILGKMQQFGFGDQQRAMLNAMTEEITKSSEIEGDILNCEQVRSSLAKRLDIYMADPVAESHHINGIVESLLDATQNYAVPLTTERLYGWHAALFPNGYSGMHKIIVGAYRNAEMEVVSSRLYDDKVHYVAPAPDCVPIQMNQFLDWVNANNENMLIKTAIAHLWFVIIHPFDDGNGRIARIITEMMLARCEQTPLRFYSMSAQIQKEKSSYYQILEQTNKGDLDITNWIIWFLQCLLRAMQSSTEIISKTLAKSQFWQKHSADIIDSRQREIINRLLDGFVGNMSTGKAAKILKTSTDTSLRLLQDLCIRGILKQCGDGRSTHYVLSDCDN